MELVTTIKNLVQTKIKNTALFLVEVKLKPGKIITVYLDADSGVTIDQCSAINHYLENVLAEELADVELQVSSAGLTVPFKIHRQYEKYENDIIEVLTYDGIKQKGLLKAVRKKEIDLEVEKKVKIKNKKKKQTITEIKTIRFDEIKKAKPVIAF